MADPITLGMSKAIEWAFGEAASEALRAVLAKRLRAAQEIALEELRRGRGAFDRPSSENAASVALRYLRAAEEGAAVRNLRLMAQVMARLPQADALYADEFLRWADVVAGLRREECIAVAALYEAEKAANLNGTEKPQVWSVAFPDVTERYSGEGRPFRTAEDLIQSLASSTRAGLVRTGSGYGGISYQTTPLMEKLASLIELKDMIDEVTP